MAGGLFDVDVFAGLDGPYGRQRVPVIGRGHRNDVHLFVGEQVPHVAVPFRLVAGRLHHRGLRALQGGLVDVADRAEAHPGLVQKGRNMVCSPAAHADDTRGHPVISAQDRPRGGVTQEEASRVRHGGPPFYSLAVSAGARSR